VAELRMKDKIFGVSAKDVGMAASYSDRPATAVGFVDAMECWRNAGRPKMPINRRYLRAIVKYSPECIDRG
jgi:hypothetical protein